MEDVRATFVCLRLPSRFVPMAAHSTARTEVRHTMSGEHHSSLEHLAEVAR
jgi:hypothetical protein